MTVLRQMGSERQIGSTSAAVSRGHAGQSERGMRANAWLRRRDARQHSRGTICPSFALASPSKGRAQGMPGATTAPAASCAKVESTRVVATGRPNSPAFPAQWFYGLSRALPGVPGFVATVACKSSLARLIPASGDQDHTALPSALALLVWQNKCVHRIPHPTSVTIAIRPS
jgi:hypothetical protein